MLVTKSVAADWAEGYRWRMRYCAFIRAINVGSHNRIRMEELRRLCTVAGLGEVSTYLQTGNVLFESAEPADDVALRLEGAFVEAGLRNAAAIVRSREQLSALIEADPLAAFPAPDFTRFVALLRMPLHASNAVALTDAFPNARARAFEVCSAFPAGQLDRGDLNGFIEKKLKVPATTRYWHVVGEVTRLLG